MRQVFTLAQALIRFISALLEARSTSRLSQAFAADSGGDCSRGTLMLAIALRSRHPRKPRNDRARHDEPQQTQ